LPNQTAKLSRPRKADIELRFEEKLVGSKEEESNHTGVQSALIELGKIIGCSLWIASNDRNRPYKGKSLGEGCLKALPKSWLKSRSN